MLDAVCADPEKKGVCKGDVTALPKKEHGYQKDNDVAKDIQREVRAVRPKQGNSDADHNACYQP